MEVFMYGTVAKLKVKPGGLESLTKFLSGRVPEGYLGSYLFKNDKKEDEMWMIAIFEDRESYFANANDPQQDKDYREMRIYLKEDPEWHDGEIVFSKDPELVNC
jgi:hypothetical protein